MPGGRRASRVLPRALAPAGAPGPPGGGAPCRGERGGPRWCARDCRPPMPGGMRASRVLPRSLALAGAVVVLCAGPAAVARADDAGTTVVGELVQAWPETSSEDQHAGESPPEPLAFVEGADGASVRIEPDAVEGIDVGSTVELTLGGTRDDEAAGDGYEPAHQVLDAQVVQAARPATTVPAGHRRPQRARAAAAPP